MTEVVTGNNSETWNNYYPVNSTVYSPSNIIRLRIPKSLFVADFSRAFITLRVNLPYSGSTANTGTSAKTIQSVEETAATFTTNVTNGATRKGTLAITNTAELFDIIDLSINGQTLYHDDFAQTSAKLNGLNRSDEWLQANQQSFIDPMVKSIPNDSQLAFKSLTFPAGYTAGSILTESKNIVIPLAMLFPCFEHVNDWPCFVVSDTLEFNLYVSRLYKYLVDLNWMEKGANERVSHYAVRGIDANENIAYSYSDGATTTPFTSTVTFYTEDFTIDNVMMMMPVHTPSDEEYNKIMNIINSTTGYMYTFKHWNVVNYLSRYYNEDGPNMTQQVNFNVTTNNMFGVCMLALKPNTEVVFEKPLINTIQVNLGPWELAANGTHLGDNYNYGGDMLQSVLDNFSQTSLEYYQTLNKQVLYDHSITYNEAYSNTTYHPTGSYITYWDASPYDELGVGGNEFSNLITYKYSLSNINSTTANWPVSNTGLGNAKTYCCIQTLSGISITAAGIECINPNSMNLTTNFINNLYTYMDDYSFRGAHGLVNHGVVSTVVGFLPQIFNGIKKGVLWIKGKIRDRLNRKHFDFYRKNLTEQEINDNLADLTHDSYYLFKKKWRKTYNRIIAERDKAHGMFMRHGIFSKITDIGIPRMRPGWRSNLSPWRKIRFERGRLINWSPFTRPTVKHGLCNTNHGLRNFFKKIWHKGKDKVYNIVNGALDRGKNILQALISGKITKEEAIAAGKKYARETGDNILDDIYAAVRGNTGHGISPMMGRKRALYNVFKNTSFDIKNFLSGRNLIPYGQIGKRIPMFLGTR